MLKRDESVHSPLPYGYIDQLRQILASWPHFRDWQWAQRALGTKLGHLGASAPEWFTVIEDQIDHDDPDSVWRIRKLSGNYRGGWAAAKYCRCGVLSGGSHYTSSSSYRCAPPRSACSTLGKRIRGATRRVVGNRTRAGRRRAVSRNRYNRGSSAAPTLSTTVRHLQWPFTSIRTRARPDGVRYRLCTGHTKGPRELTDDLWKERCISM